MFTQQWFSCPGLLVKTSNTDVVGQRCFGGTSSGWSDLLSMEWCCRVRRRRTTRNFGVAGSNSVRDVNICRLFLLLSYD